ncbi:hypothetical protein QYM36_008660 [Artemia franciscana]|uniref:Homeobox domain-containing protein n=1 Tax=Artemia franciscana TaxID=6661 RepID=A0AA88L084_ARTSF|nr:hypothetical protein QYM36_008660 [Artemia franciscana]
MMPVLCVRALTLADQEDAITPRLADDSYGSEVSDEESKDRKLKLSHEQKEALQMAFNIDPYSSQGSLDPLSKELNLPSKSVMNWFSSQKLNLMQEDSVLTQGITPSQTPFYGASYSPEMLYMLYNMQSAAPGLNLRTSSHKPESPSRGSEVDCHSDISAPGSPVESREDTPEGEDSDADETRKDIKEEKESSPSDITINCVVKRDPQDLALTKDENYNTEEPVLQYDFGLSEAVNKENDEL